MKLLLGLMFLATAALSQILPASQVPTAIHHGFATRFPSVKTVEWKLKAGKNYEAELKLKGAEVAAKFDISGKWLETETTIPRSEVPESVSAALDNRFPSEKSWKQRQSFAGTSGSDLRNSRCKREGIRQSSTHTRRQDSESIREI